MLESRQEAIKRINEQFGTNISVKLSSSWVRREKIVQDEEQEQPKQEEPKQEEPEKQPEEKEKGEDE